MLKYRLHQGITTISCLLPPSKITPYASTHSGLQEFLPPPCHPTPYNVYGGVAPKLTLNLLFS